MVKKLFMFGMIFLLVLTFSLGAAVKVTGKWELVTKAKKGEKTNIVKMVQDGEKLTVVMKAKKKNKLEGTGTVKGNNIEWTITRKNEKSTAIFKYSGVISGDTMKGELQIEKNKKKKPAREWTASRKKPDNTKKKQADKNKQKK